MPDQRNTFYCICSSSTVLKNIWDASAWTDTSNDEYEREQQHLAKQIKRTVILRDDHIFAFCVVRKRAQILELFQRNAYVCFAFLLTLFTLRCTCMTDRPSQKHVPCLLIHTCWFKGHGDVCKAYTVNTYT